MLDLVVLFGGRRCRLPVCDFDGFFQDRLVNRELRCGLPLEASPFFVCSLIVVWQSTLLFEKLSKSWAFRFTIFAAALCSGVARFATMPAAGEISIGTSRR